MEDNEMELPKMVTIGKPQITSTIMTSAGIGVGSTMFVIGALLFRKEPKKQAGLMVAGGLIAILSYMCVDNPDFK